MASVARLVTLVDVDDGVGDPRQLSLAVRHEAVLADGRRVPLLRDRGWRTSLGELGLSDRPDAGSSCHGKPDVTAVWSIEAVQEAARFLVGPDEPPVGRSQAEMEARHWGALSRLLEKHGVVVDPLHLRELPHEVVLSKRLLLTLIGRGRRTAVVGQFA